MSADLAGRVAVVTGAGGGIGRAVAETLAAQGCRLAAMDRERDKAEATCAAIAAAGGEAIALVCDVADPAQVLAAADDTAGRLGPAHVLVNNAGLLRAASLSEVSLEDWNALLAVNLTGYLLCAQAFGRAMREAGAGSLVHIASIGGRYATPHAGAYSVAKAGVVMLARQLALEWAPYGIRSNSISPGLIETPMTAAFHAQPGVAAARAAMVPAGRLGRPEDIARAVAWLAGAQSAYVTGHDLTVDGGLTEALMGLLPRPGFGGQPR